MKKNKAILFDRDGVVNYRIVGDYVKNIDEFCFLPDFLDFFNFIKQNNYLSFLVTNQQGVGKGLMSEDQLSIVHSFMQLELNRITGYCFDDIRYCTKLANSNSFYRKPNPGMLLNVIDKYDIDKSASIMIGDSRSDILAGKAAGLKTILLAPAFLVMPEEPNFVFKNLYEVKANFNNIL
jgi:D-glycero-D-manno-heptose 1,7-bisphosphate phosphatase